MSSSSPMARHLMFHFSRTESSLTPASRKTLSSRRASLHLKPQFGATFRDCRVSSISVVTGSSSAVSSSSPASAGDCLCRTRMTSLATSSRAFSRSTSISCASVLAAHMPFGFGRAWGPTTSPTRTLPRLLRRSALLPPCSPPLSSASSAEGGFGGGLLGPAGRCLPPSAALPSLAASIAGVTPNAPTVCPASVGSSTEMSRNGSSRKETLLQPQQRVAAQRWPLKFRWMQSPQQPVASLPGFSPASLARSRSALVVSSEMDPSKV
mmetsp:Transcript_110781/g.294277  ORF Transcript_110781/g.294277 Transcript_110781/m.294277 type:complete len:266 (+) Transcript_110781:964-1761(+)